MNKRENKFGEELREILEFQNIGISEYAERVGTTSKNLIDILDGKVTLSFNMICNISFISNIPVNYICNVEESFKIDRIINSFIEHHNITLRQFINKFHYKELKEKYNIVYNNDLNDYSIARSILKYLRITNPENIYKKDNTIFYKSNNDKPELLALWLEHCYRTVLNQEVGEYRKEYIEKIVRFINDESKNRKFDKEKLIEVFNKYGIKLAIEPDLKGSKIRGAFKVLNNTPAIYITTKHKRIADIYFALLHELAHCKSDFNRAKSGSIVSYMNNNDTEDYEIKADKTALNWMVPEKIYENIIKTKNYSYDNMCFLVYRLAFDKKISYSSKIYQDNNKLLDKEALDD